MCIVRVSAHYPGLANLALEPFGVAHGESAAACRYFMQALIEDDPPGAICRWIWEFYRSITGAGNASHLTQVPYSGGGGAPLTNDAGLPFRAEFIDMIGAAQTPHSGIFCLVISRRASA
jgi:Mn-containing catalase